MGSVMGAKGGDNGDCGKECNTTSIVLESSADFSFDDM